MTGSNHAISALRCWSTMAGKMMQQQQQQPVSPQYFFSSVSSPEVAKFNAMHQDWWDAGKNPLIGMNAVRMQYIRQQVMKHQSVVASSSSSISSCAASSVLPLQGLKALDIGCGGGVACESLVRLGASQVIGLDPSSDLIAAAQRHAANTSLLDITQRGNGSSNNNTLNYKNMSVEDFLAQHQTNNNINDNNTDTDDMDSSPYFDLICLLEVMEHVPESSLASLLTATSKLLHPTRGLLFVSTMSSTPLAYALTILGAEYIMRYLPIGTHDFNLYRSPAHVRQVMAATGSNLEQVNVTGMILAGPPPIMGMGSWNWKLDPSNTQVNWIGTYRKQSESNE